MRRALVLTVAFAAACRCGGPEASGDWKGTFDALLGKLPEAQTHVPLEVLPRDFPWILTSPDPAKVHELVAGTSSWRAFVGTPLFQDLVGSRSYQAIDGVRRAVSRAGSFGVDPDDADALWRGATAVGIDDPFGPSPRFLLVKHVDPALRSAVRLAAAFASVEGGADQPVRRAEWSGRVYHFAVFRDLLIVGSDPAQVERARALAAGTGDAEPASKDPLMPTPERLGLHLRVRDERIGGLSVSYVGDPKAPFVLRREGAAEGAQLALLRYAPASASVAFVEAPPPIAELLGKLEGELGEPPLGPGKKRRPRFSADALAGALEPGLLAVLGARDEQSAPGRAGLLLVVRHRDVGRVRAQAQALFEQLTGKLVAPVTLEEHGGATVLALQGVEPALGVTEDALVIGQDEDAVRRAIAAGLRHAPSLADRAGEGEAQGALYVDLPRLGRFLEALYADALAGDPGVKPGELEAVLGPSFAVLRDGPALLAKLSPPKEGVREGALEVLP